MSAKVELKPCPFCGGNAHIVRLKESVKEKYYVACGNSLNRCIASHKWVFGRFYSTREEAIEAWNRRIEE